MENTDGEMECMK